MRLKKEKPPALRTDNDDIRCASDDADDARGDAAGRARSPARQKARERRCIVTGRTFDAPLDKSALTSLIRFVLDPDGRLAVDLAERLPGRGAWVSAERAVIEKAATSGAFSRAFRCAVTPPTDLAAIVEAGLKQRALDALGLARRAGAAIAGFEKVKAALEGGKLALLISAQDSADDGVSRLRRSARGVETMSLFSSADLSQALGLDGVRHIGVSNRASAGRQIAQVRRYAAFISDRGKEPPNG